MRSSLPKALHPLAGKPLVQHVLDAVCAMGPVKPVLVVGHKADMVRKAVERYTMDIVYQERQLGTGHAVRQAADAIAQAEGPVMVLCADTPLLRPATLASLAEAHVRAKAAVTVMTAKVDDPEGYGRIFRGRSGILRIVEEKDATKSQKKVRRCMASIASRRSSSSPHRRIKTGMPGRVLFPDTIPLARKRHGSPMSCEDPVEP
jgi:bifunctional UDP-N-acetylglucosamine pyrophosphorylase/glucosamine-1-phosphate N-acetyltransferase